MKNILFLSREINRRCAIKLDALYAAAKALGCSPVPARHWSRSPTSAAGSRPPT